MGITTQTASGVNDPPAHHNPTSNHPVACVYRPELKSLKALGILMNNFEPQNIPANVWGECRRTQAIPTATDNLSSRDTSD